MLKAAYFHSRLSLLVYWLRCILGNFHSSDELSALRLKAMSQQEQWENPTPSFWESIIKL